MGIDTSIAEGREEFKKEWMIACELVPELLSKEDMIYPHETANTNDVPDEHIFRECGNTIESTSLSQDLPYWYKMAKSQSRMLSCLGTSSTFIISSLSVSISMDD